MDSYSGMKVELNGLGTATFHGTNRDWEFLILRSGILACGPDIKSGKEATRRLNIANNTFILDIVPGHLSKTPLLEKIKPEERKDTTVVKLRTTDGKDRVLAVAVVTPHHGDTKRS